MPTHVEPSRRSISQALHQRFRNHLGRQNHRLLRGSQGPCAVAHGALQGVFSSTSPGGQGTCAGPAPTSASFLFVEVPCGPMEEDGDGSGDAGATTAYTIIRSRPSSTPAAPVPSQDAAVYPQKVEAPHESDRTGSGLPPFAMLFEPPWPTFRHTVYWSPEFVPMSIAAIRMVTKRLHGRAA